MDDRIGVRISKLSRRYGDTAVVNALSLEIRRGEIFGLLGPNGAGKTTTLGMLATLVEPPWLRTFAYATPTGWAMEGPNEIILRESGLAAVTSTIGIPVAYGAACLAAGVRFYRMSD